jgi:hypothetical protein
MMALLVILLTHLLMASSAHAQGVGGVYCAQYSDGSSPDCGFSSLQMCEQSVTGVGGVCTQNPAGPSAALAGGQGPYVSPPVPQLPFVQPSAFPAAPVPPPPGEINSLSSDLAMRGNPPATLGAVNFSGAGSSACIGLFGRAACGGT